ncbi:MAG: hypothetical protein MUQ10_08805, partial [Anaerolineae bacterium]|nr:hypothetical protein [Anaerolineae bacterium]
THQQIRRGERLRTVLTQRAHDPYSLSSQIISLIAAVDGLLDEIHLRDIPIFEQDLMAHLKDKHPGLVQKISREGELTDQMSYVLTDSMRKFHEGWITARNSQITHRG